MLNKILSRTMIIRLLAMSLSLVCVNAFSSGVRKIEILQKKSVDKDTYMVKPKWSTRYDMCVQSIWPWDSATTPGYEYGDTIHIAYLSTIDYCDTNESSYEFQIQSEQHPSRVAYFLWIKHPGEDAKAIIINRDNSTPHLLWINNEDSKNIKVWVGCDNRYCH